MSDLGWPHSHGKDMDSIQRRKGAAGQTLGEA